MDADGHRQPVRVVDIDECFIRFVAREALDRLLHSSVEREFRVGFLPYVMVGDFGIVPAAEYAVVHVGEMGEVHEVLESPMGASSPVIERPLQHLERRILELRELGNIEYRLVRQANADQTRRLARMKSPQPRTSRDPHTETSGDRGVNTVYSVGPAVIHTTQLVSFVPAERQGGPSVATQIAETPYRTFHTRKHQLFAE